MTLNEYQEKAMQTCMPSCDNMAYMLTNLVAEVGELAGKIAKPIRREAVAFNHNQLEPISQYDEDDILDFADLTVDMALEAGDVLWQLSGVVTKLGYTLDEVAKMNLEKLASRAKRGKIDGNGDHR